MTRRVLDLSLYLVTDTELCGEFGVAATVSAAIGAGVSVVQLRDPAATDDEFVALGREIAAVLRGLRGAVDRQQPGPPVTGDRRRRGAHRAG